LFASTGGYPEASAAPPISSALANANHTASNEKKLAEFSKEIQKVSDARQENRPIGVVTLFAAASARVPETNAVRILLPLMSGRLNICSCCL